MPVETKHYSVNTDTFDRCCIISELIKIAEAACARLPSYDICHIENKELHDMMQFSTKDEMSRNKLHRAFATACGFWAFPIMDIDNSRAAYQHERRIVVAMQPHCEADLQIPSLLRSGHGSYMTVKFVYDGMYYQYTASSTKPGTYSDEAGNYGSEIDCESVFVPDNHRSLIKVPVHADGTLDLPEAGIGVPYDTSTVMHWSLNDVDTTGMSDEYDAVQSATICAERDKAYKQAAQKLWQMLLQAEPLTTVTKLDF